MWWSIVVVLKGQSIEEAVLYPEQILCSYDGSVHGDRQAKKMSKRDAHGYVSAGHPGQPRVIKTPMEPYGAEEVAEAERLLSDLQPPG